MKRTFNFTDRINLNRSNISVALHTDEQNKLYFDANINLDESKFPGDAKVFIEAYYKNSFMRFPYGQIQELSAPEKRSLDDIQGDTASFRLKVVENREDNFGRILGSISRLVPSLPDSTDVDRTSLLFVKKANLDNRIWKLEFEDTMPILLVNNMDEKVAIREFIRSNPLFLSLVFPSVVETIFKKIFEDFSEDEDDWKSKWIKYAEVNLSISLPPSLRTDGQSAEKDVWIDSVVNEFCKKFKIKNRFTKLLQEIGE